MQKNSYEAADWLPKIYSGVYRLNVEPENQRKFMSVASLVSEKYDDQIRSAANMESQSAAASDLIGCNESYSQ